MSHSTLRFFASSLLISFLLAACAPATAQPSGPSAEEMEALIGTSVALTLTAHVQTQVAAYTPTPMDTATPTVTTTAIFPSLTPFSTPTKFITSPGGGWSPTPADYACAVVHKSPADNSIFKPNKDFDVKFFLRNVGARRWDKGADLAYHEGTKMVTTNYFYELPKVEPGETVGPFIFDAMTPKKVGTYTMTFKLQGGFCYPYIRIIVQK